MEGWILNIHIVLAIVVDFARRRRLSEWVCMNAVNVCRDLPESQSKWPPKEKEKKFNVNNRIIFSRKNCKKEIEIDRRSVVGGLFHLTMQV